MTTDRPRRLVLALLVLAALAALVPACERPAPRARPDQRRAVVDPLRPLALANPQAATVTWPVWGSAFATGEPVTVRAAVAAADGTGLLVAGPGEPDTRVAVAVVREGGAWVVRSGLGTAPAAAQRLAEAAEAALELRVDASGRRVDVRVGRVARAVVLDRALGPGAGVWVTLAPGAGLELRALEIDRPLPAHPELGPPLARLAAAHGRRIGSVTDLWPPRSDVDYESLLAGQFSLAAVTDLYWATVRGEDEDYFFLPADLLVNFAAVHDQAVLGMFLVWDYALPAWLLALAEAEDAAAIGAALDEHIATVVGRYVGRVDAWVVVNEAILGADDSETGAPQITWSPWSAALGPAFIERAFRAARAADPAATLLYNETDVEVGGAKTDFMLGLLADLLARGVPVDAVGLQYHLDAAAPPARVELEATMQRIAALGLEVWITELDVSLANLGELDRADAEAVQAAIYADVVDACLNVAACRVISIFGVSDRDAWDELGDAAPLLFDEAFAPKPAFFSVQAHLAR